MSSIGRIFVILNLVLAAAFLGYASTSLAKGSEWKKKYEAESTGHAATKAALDADKSKLLADLNSEKAQKEQYLAQFETAKNESLRNSEDLESAKRNNAELSARLASIDATLAGYNQTIAAMNATKDAAVAQSAELSKALDAAQRERDQAVTTQRDAADTSSAAQVQIAQLERDLKAAKSEASRKDSELQQLIAMTGVDRNAISAAPPIEARVLQVKFDPKPGLVALNVGSEQGVTRGMTFQIYSGNVWKGQVRVESVQASMSSALITDMSSGQTIAQGDSAATIL